MANKIQGITIQLGADTTELNKALDSVNKTTRQTQSELNQVNKLLRFNPESTELLGQAQQLLGEQISNTETKLDALRQAQTEVERKFASGEIDASAYREFQRQIIQTESSLDNFRRQASDIDARIDVQADPSALNKASSAIKGLADDAKTAGRKIGTALSDGFKLATKGVALLTAGITGASVGLSTFVESQRETNTLLARLNANALNAGVGTDFINEKLQKLSAITGDAGASVETLSNLIETPLSEDQITTALESIQGATIRFSDTLKAEGIADGLQETFAVGESAGAFTELLERSGVNIETFNEGLAQSIKNGTQADYVLQQLADLGLSSTLESYVENNKALVEYNEAQAKQEILLGNLANRLTPIATGFTGLGNSILDVVLGNVSLKEAFDNTISTLGSLGSGLIETASTAIPQFVNTIREAFPSILETGTEILGNILQGIISKYPDLFKAVYDIVLGIIKTLVDNFPKILQTGFNLLGKVLEGIRTALPQLIQYIVGTLIPNVISILANADWFGIGLTIVRGILNGIQSLAGILLDSVLAIFKGIADAIINIFKNIQLPELKFPKIKLPRITVEGDFSLSPLSIPKFGIEFFAKGGVMTEPTVFGRNGNNAMVGGEAGAEAIIPLTSDVLAGIGRGISQQMESFNQSIIIQASPIYLDGTLIGEATFDTVNNSLGSNTRFTTLMKGV